MGQNSKIEWTDHTANFWWGCFKVSPGCANCYAETWSKRMGKRIWGPAATTEREYKKGVWSEVVKWNRKAKADGVRRRVFVLSMADFFEDHPQVVEWRRDALRLMIECPNLDFQVLTKRPENVNRMIEESTGFSDSEMWFHSAPHVWIGTSVENQATADERVPELIKVPAAVRFLSCEPLLGPVDLRWMSGLWDYTPVVWSSAPKPQIHWVIVGGESGPKSRPIHPDWARSIRDQCVTGGVKFFFKQWGEWMPYEANEDYMATWTGWIDNHAIIHQFETGGIPPYRPVYRVGKKAAGRLLDGREWNEMPEAREVTE